MTMSHQIGIYCYFDFDDIYEKLRSFLLVKHKASINAIKYVQTYAHKGTLSPRAGLRCKITIIFTDIQKGDNELLCNHRAIIPQIVRQEHISHVINHIIHRGCGKNQNKPVVRNMRTRDLCFR